MHSPVVVESYGSFWVVGVHPGEEDPIFDDVASKKSGRGWVRCWAEDCVRGEDAFQAFFAGVVVENGGRGHDVWTTSDVVQVVWATLRMASDAKHKVVLN